MRSDISYAVNIVTAIVAFKIKCKWKISCCIIHNTIFSVLFAVSNKLMYTCMRHCRASGLCGNGGNLLPHLAIPLQDETSWRVISRPSQHGHCSVTYYLFDIHNLYRVLLQTTESELDQDDIINVIKCVNIRCNNVHACMSVTLCNHHLENTRSHCTRNSHMH